MNDTSSNEILARVAERAERYDDMSGFIIEIATNQKSLDSEQRDLLSVAFKNVIGTRRTSWRFLQACIQDQKLKISMAQDNANADPKVTSELVHHLDLIEPLRLKIMNEFLAISLKIQNLVLETLLPNAQTDEEKIFYHKMAADYFRYTSEFQTGDERQETVGKAFDNYLTASELAAANFKPTHPLRLGLALNFSVFYYEVLKSPRRACALAQQTFDEAVPDLDTLDDEMYHESKLIIKLLRDNLGFWTNEIEIDESEVETPNPDTGGFDDQKSQNDEPHSPEVKQ